MPMIDYIPDFNTGVFDPTTLNEVELCNRLKEHFDALVMMLYFGEYQTSMVNYEYQLISGENRLSKEVISVGWAYIIIEYTYYTYSHGTKLRRKKMSITPDLNVPPVGAMVEKEYDYNQDGTLNWTSTSRN